MSNYSRTIGLDQYQRTAQLYPAVLCAAPLFAEIAVWAPGTIGIVPTLGSLGMSAAIAMLAMQIVRRLGRNVEEKYSLGVSISISALKHDGDLINKAERQRYHDYLRTCGLVIPTEDQQNSNPSDALARFEAAISWIRENTRDERKYRLLQIENQNYGFRRNLFGLKPVGVSITLLMLFINIFLIYYFDISINKNPSPYVLTLVLTFVIIAWGIFINPEFVREASNSYAIRLLSACDILSNDKKSKKKS